MTYFLEVMGEPFVVEDVPVQVTADPARGEVRRRLEVIPPVSLALTRDVQLFAPRSTRTVEVDALANRPKQTGEVRLDVPEGWSVSPEKQPFSFDAAGGHARFAFQVTAPGATGRAKLSAGAATGGGWYNTGRQEIRYEHIPTQLLQPPATVRAACADLQVSARRVGYLPGAGDRTAEALEQMGCAVTVLNGADLVPERLKNFDAVVVGVRAFNVRTDLAAGLPALFAFAEEGGTVVAQYNTPGELKTDKLAPYKLTLSRDSPKYRVTDENAPMTFLAPDHPALNTPNKITPADFEGWTQERGIYFPAEWDHEHFTALLACNDKDEEPLQSGLLVARHGKGYFVYTGLSFFRQLPAGVPGAYRLFANLVSLGR